VDVNGPALDVKWGKGSSATVVLGLLLAERGTPDEKLGRVFELAADTFRNVVMAAHREQSPQCKFEPYLRVTDEAVELWWGAPAAEKSPVRLRPIPRSELGL
jgi:hypothetical protein